MRPAGPSHREVGWAFLLCVAYVALSLALRLATGPALEVDEAEVWLQAQLGYALGYGPQFPLYYWIQFGLFDVFGKSLAVIDIFRSTLMALTVFFAFLALRQAVGAMSASLAAASLIFLPDYAWVSQMTLTHTRIMAALAMATFVAFAWFLRTGRMAAIVWLGVALGLGGLSKPNFWFVPIILSLAALSIPAYRARMRDKRLLLALVIGAAIVVAPYGWIILHPTEALASINKFALPKPGTRMIVTLIGLFDLTKWALYAMLPLVFLVAIFRSFCAHRPDDSAPDAEVFALFCMRAAFSGFAIAILFVVLAGAGQFKSHWLMFATPFAAFALVLPLLARMSLLQRRIWGALAILAVIGTQTSLAVLRDTPPATHALDAEALAHDLEQRFGADRLTVIGDFYWSGNLARTRPDWDVRALTPPGSVDGEILMLTKLPIGSPEGILRWLKLGEWSAGQQVVLTPAFIAPSTEDRPVHARILTPPG
ncbi:MAG: hypothetical protein GKR99_00165 [Rhodobacteraceae bacterium]|nr:hypothetical protein [Paracoccaceae bacterium]